MMTDCLHRLRAKHAQQEWLYTCRADVIFCCYSYLSDGVWRTEADIWDHILSLGLADACWCAVGWRDDLHVFIRRHMTYLLVDTDVHGHRRYCVDIDNTFSV